MPRKPGRHRRLLYQPIAFCKLGRSVPTIAAAYMHKRRQMNSKLNGEVSTSPVSSGNGNGKHILKGKGRGPVSESSDDEVSDEEIQADFAFFDPKPEDFHGVKTLFQTYLDDKQWDLSAFVDLILAQTTVGTVVKIEDDEDNGSFALATALNLARYKEHKCVKEVKDYLFKACQGNTLFPELKALFDDRADNAGLLISQRVMNLPPQLLPHLYDALFDEIKWGTEDEPTEELRRSFRFKKFLIISKIYKLSWQKISRGKKGSSSSCEEDIIYLKAEDELFHKLCSWSFTFPSRTQLPVANELKGYRLAGLVMAVEAEKISTFRQDLKSLIEDGS